MKTMRKFTVISALGFLTIGQSFGEITRNERAWIQNPLHHDEVNDRIVARDEGGLAEALGAYRAQERGIQLGRRTFQQAPVAMLVLVRNESFGTIQSVTLVYLRPINLNRGE